MYFNIQRFSTHDGDGIRTILFLKGCTLACPWCQNPESRSRLPSVLYDSRRCISGCERCTEQCAAIHRDSQHSLTIDRAQLSQQDVEKLRHCCPAQALTVCGNPLDSEAIYAELISDKAFFIQGGGGVTFSGGEPLLHSEWVAELAQRLHQEPNITTAIETCLHAPKQAVQRLLPHIDCWLTDLKHVDANKFQHWTKGSIKPILRNFALLAEHHARFIIRIPVIPEFNASDQELRAMIDYAVTLSGCEAIHLLPYHTLGMNKYQLLDEPYLCSTQPLNDPDLLKRCQSYAEQYALPVTIRG